jgi:hypothetical protein
MVKSEAPIPIDLSEMKQKLAEWRSAQPTRTPLPNSLWQPIIKLAQKHGLYRTARTLPIDYGTLKRRCDGNPVRRKSTAPTSFVELIPAVTPTTGCVIEMIRMETTGEVNWAQLFEAWRRRAV